MPEGDTIFRTATTLGRALGGDVLVRFATHLEPLGEQARRFRLEGRRVDSVEARGKHLLIHLARNPDAGGEAAAIPYLVLHTHMGMSGAWHLYRLEEERRMPRAAQVVLVTERFLAPCYRPQLAELLTPARAARHPALSRLGPDAIRDGFSVPEALTRLRTRPELEIGEALLRQDILAGVGNVYKSEVLFIRRVSPFRRVGELSDTILTGLLDEASALLRANRLQGPRRTCFALEGSGRLWVYGRSGRPCRACGGPIRMRRQGEDARSTYFCPHCQSSGPEGLPPRIEDASA
jgi:endonuclease-8